MAKAVRIAAAVAFLLLAGAQVVRSALVASDSYGLAREHPSAIKSEVMTAVGLAAARGENPPASALAGLKRLAGAEPLAPEPFLVHGAIAFRSGETERAEALLVEARKRAPRGPAARYLLADLYLRTGRPLPAMVEMSVLHRLLPDSSGQLAQSLAAYAKLPGGARQLAEIIRSYPELEPPLLEELAADPANAALVIALEAQTPGRAPGTWRDKLVGTLIDAGRYERAHQVWQQLAGVRAPAGALFNPGFDSSDAPPPFNWLLIKDRGGVAEARSGGLQLLYYGREDLDLAAQTMLLRAGRYRLSLAVTGQTGDPRSLRWTIDCIGGGRLLDLPLPGGSGSRPVAGEFTVPAGCRAQRITLRAEGSEFPKEADATVSNLRLEKAGP